MLAEFRCLDAPAESVCIYPKCRRFPRYYNFEGAIRDIPILEMVCIWHCRQTLVGSLNTSIRNMMKRK